MRRTFCFFFWEGENDCRVREMVGREKGEEACGR